MLSCLKQLPSTSTTNYFSSPASQVYSSETTPRSGAQLSPTINLTHEYTRAVQTDSYGEIRKTFDEDNSTHQTADIQLVDTGEESELLERVLQPSREYVKETLSLIDHNPLAHFVATFFRHSEDSSRLCFLLSRSVLRARLLYAPIYDLLDDLPADFDFESDSYSLSDSHINLAHKFFLQFDCLENPFLSPDSQSFNDMRQCFSDLRQQLDHHVQKSQSRVHDNPYCSRNCALCLLAAGVSVAFSAVAIATHALVVLVGAPICLTIFPASMNREGKDNLTHHNSVSRKAYVLQKDLDTIERLVAHLHSDVESDKQLIHLELDRGIDNYFIHEKLKQLQRNRPSFIQRLESFEDHLYICFAAINRTRSGLLQEIHLQENQGGSSHE